jgi:protein O-mannosyl-transferase
MLRQDKDKDPVRTVTAPRLSLQVAGVMLLTFVVYLRCLGNGFVLDDKQMVLDNPYIGRWSFLWRSLFNDAWWFHHTPGPGGMYYRPLQLIWLGLNYQLFGLHPGAWHATMVALHLAAALLVFRIALSLTGAWSTALVASLTFGLHPAHAGAVSYASAIQAPLSATFQLAAFYLVMDGTRPGRRGRALALLCYAGALLTHESAVVLPGLVAAYSFLFEAPMGEDRSVASRLEQAWPRILNALVRAAPFAVEVIIYLIARKLVLGSVISTMPQPLNYLTNGQALMTMPRVLAADLLLLALWTAAPSGLVAVAGATWSQFYLTVVALIALGVTFILLVRAHPHRPLYLFCAAWMVIALAPMMNVRGLPQLALIQDRYLYLPSVGWCVMLASLADDLASPGVWWGRFARMGAAAVLVFYAWALWRAEGYWHDDVTYYTAEVEKAPEDAGVHYNLGAALEERGDLAGAEREFNESLRLKPHSPVLYDLGVVHSRLGRIKDAVAEEAEGLAHLPFAPPDAYVGLAQLYDRNGQPREAEEVLDRLESLAGGANLARLARAQMKYNHGDLTGADNILRDLAARDPSDSRVWTMLGLVASHQQHHEEALSDYQHAVALTPLDIFSRTMAALTLHRVGRDTEALDQCREILALSPKDPNAQALMAKIEHTMESHQPPPNPAPPHRKILSH